MAALAVLALAGHRFEDVAALYLALPLCALHHHAVVLDATAVQEHALAVAKCAVPLAAACWREGHDLQQACTSEESHKRHEALREGSATSLQVLGMIAK